MEAMKEKIKTTAKAKVASNKQPLSRAEHPLARDSRGAATRTEIRKQTARGEAPRQSFRPKGSKSGK
jgi:hypothetical protein